VLIPVRFTSLTAYTNLFFVPLQAIRILMSSRVVTFTAKQSLFPLGLPLKKSLFYLFSKGL